jgi:sodium/bile acid cotransporter 7
MPTAADRVAYGFCSTHKSLALGLPLLRVVFSGDSRLALLITPLLVQHPFQLFFGSALVPRLTEIVAADKEKGA